MCVCRDAVCRRRCFWGGNEAVFRKNKAGGAAQLLEEVSGCSHLLQCRFAAAFEGGTMAPRSPVSAITVPVGARGGFDPVHNPPGTQRFSF